ncbi:unnamed protein product [Ectocarpus fasciculatus]
MDGKRWELLAHRDGESLAFCGRCGFEPVLFVVRARTRARLRDTKILHTLRPTDWTSRKIEMNGGGTTTASEYCSIGRANRLTNENAPVCDSRITIANEHAF